MALHRKKLREAGDRSAASIPPITILANQDDFSSQNRPTLNLSSSAQSASPTAPKPNPQSAEPVVHFETKYQIDLSKYSFVDKQMISELRPKERNVQQATFDSHNQGGQSEEVEEPENVRLCNASANRERNTKMGRPNHSFMSTTNNPHLFYNRSNNRYNVSHSDQNHNPMYHQFQQTTQSVYQSEPRLLVPEYEKSRAGPLCDRRMLTALAKVYTSDSIKYSGDM